jgi:hypothetical protein
MHVGLLSSTLVMTLWMRAELRMWRMILLLLWVKQWPLCMLLPLLRLLLGMLLRLLLLLLQHTVLGLLVQVLYLEL